MIIYIYILVAFLLFRIFQRLYFLIKGHPFLPWRFVPSEKMRSLIKINNLSYAEYWTENKRDDTKIFYRSIGRGSRKVLLANGVGTNFYMWFAIFYALAKLFPQVFDEITIIAPVYRGLLLKDSIPFRRVRITLSDCVDDILAVLQHCKLKSVDTIIGWSMGAQIALLLCSKHPKITNKLFLLNPSTGKTLHTTLQPFRPGPPLFGQILSGAIHSARDILQPVCDTFLWSALKSFAASEPFYLILCLLAFLTGAPPTQPAYFFDYMQDVFSSRSHTKHLLDLVVSLDEALPIEALHLPHKAVIASGKGAAGGESGTD